jgi:hypothetical protein
MPHFTLIFLTVVGITVSAIVASVVLAMIWPTLTANQQTVFESLGWLYKVGFGAIIGLLSSKIGRDGSDGLL